MPRDTDGLEAQIARHERRAWHAGGVTGYRQLEGPQLAHTVARLHERIDARFHPPRGLGAVAGDLEKLVVLVDRDTDDSATRAGRSRLVARTLSALIVAASLVALVLVLVDAADEGPNNSFDWLPLIESTINDVVFAAIAVLFLWALPERLERRRLLALLHQLRSLAHVIDMHQLSKDPEQVLASYRPTPASVKADLAPSSCTTTSTTAPRCCRWSPRPRPCAPSTRPTRSCSTRSARSSR